MTSWYPTQALTYGGVFVREHAKAVRSAGHQVVVLHLAGPRGKIGARLWTMEEELDPTLSEGIEAHHVFHRRSRVPGVSYALYLRSGIAAYRRVLRNGFRPDVIHAHVYGAGVPAAIVASRSGIPLVQSEHFSGIAQRTLSRLEVRKARFAYKQASRVLPVSRFLGEAIESYGIGSRYEVVPNAVDTSLFFPGNRAVPEDTHRILFVGNLEPSDLKGFPTLLQALARLRELRSDWSIDVVGDGTGRAQYEVSTAELGLREHVAFRGSRPKSVIAELMRGADLLVLPSRVETFGAVAAEAMACGLPVVTTTVGGIPELVDGRSGRLVPADDPLALSNALHEVLENLESFDRRTMSAVAHDRFGADAVGAQLSRIYRAVLAERSAS